MEELAVALSLCSDRTRMVRAGVRAWTAVHTGKTIHFVRTGMGPHRSAVSLEKLLGSFRPAEILVIGYAGALSQELKVGTLAIIRRVSILGGAEGIPVPLEEATAGQGWELVHGSRLLEIARATGVPACLCDGLTSAHIIGEPGQKHFLNDRFGAGIIDMETAALARVAATEGIPLSCVRSVSDDVDDTFLAPFTYAPDLTALGRARKVVSARRWFQRYGEWRRRAALARDSLRKFLTAYLNQDSGVSS